MKALKITNSLRKEVAQWLPRAEGSYCKKAHFPFQMMETFCEWVEMGVLHVFNATDLHLKKLFK